jgi:phytoene desaturase
MWRYFKNPRIHRLLEFPIFFLGGTGDTTPALYSLMNYGDLKLGTWYPMGGMYELVDAMHKLAIEMGATFHFETEAKELEINNGEIKAVVTDKGRFEADYVIGAGDYQHIEQNLVPEKYRMYSKKYWDKRVMSPSSLIFISDWIRSWKVSGITHCCSIPTLTPMPQRFIKTPAGLPIRRFM